ncbi:MAG: AsmA family protein [Puniceicoccales bacterium]|jgi:uncharacterized protein involved in outer membrane biogenesis|nr:AsmA family protein [Puniceicoccales bacterium]
MVKFLVKGVAMFALKLITAAAVLLFLILLAGNFWIPTAIEFALTKTSGFKTSIGKSSGSIFRGRLDLKDFIIKNPDSFHSKDFVSINNIVTDVDMTTLFKDTIVIENIILDVTDLTVVTNANGENNYTLFSKNFTPEPQTSEKEASKTIDTKKHSPKRSVLIKNLTLSISTIHTIDERKNSSREYEINYRREFHDVTDFTKLGMQLIGDLGKFGNIIIDSVISSIPIIPNVATDGIIKVKDISLDAVSKTKDLAVKVGDDIGNKMKQLFKKDK